MTARRAIAAICCVAGLAALVLASWIAVHGRIDIYPGGRHLAIRRVTPVSLGAWLLLCTATAAAGRAWRDSVLMRVDALVSRHAAIAAAVLAVAVGTTCLLQGAFTAAGADPYGYVSQARLWADGSPLTLLPAVALDAPVDAAAFCPLGYKPGPVPGTIVPGYSAGYPMIMASLETAAGPAAGFMVVPLAAALAVWLTFVVGRRYMTRGWALAVAACVACSPVFLFQAMQPMSDVPMTALCLGGVALGLRGTMASGIAAGAMGTLAILTRPNLLPLILPLSMFLAMDEAHARTFVRGVAFALGCLPGVVLVAAIDQVLYGSALTSGYGRLVDLYAAGGAAGTAWGS